MISIRSRSFIEARYYTTSDTISLGIPVDAWNPQPCLRVDSRGLEGVMLGAGLAAHAKENEFLQKRGLYIIIHKCLEARRLPSVPNRNSFK